MVALLLKNRANIHANDREDKESLHKIAEMVICRLVSFCFPKKPMSMRVTTKAEKHFTRLPQIAIHRLLSFCF